MDYKDENGNWIGFDADMAKLVGEKLGVDVEFKVIDWDMKIMELDSKNIDVVWNGMTLTDEVTSSMNCTNPISRTHRSLSYLLSKARVTTENSKAEGFCSLPLVGFID